MLLSEHTPITHRGCRTFVGILPWVRSSSLLGTFSFLFYYPRCFNNFVCYSYLLVLTVKSNCSTYEVPTMHTKHGICTPMVFLPSTSIQFLLSLLGKFLFSCYFLAFT